jgi:hypothetical protein
MCIHGHTLTITVDERAGMGGDERSCSYTAHDAPAIARMPAGSSTATAFPRRRDRDVVDSVRHMSQALLKGTAVARRLGLSAQRVRQMDDVLKPMRTEDGTRIYRADEVERVAARRDAQRGRR